MPPFTHFLQTQPQSGFHRSRRNAHSLGDFVWRHSPKIAQKQGFPLLFGQPAHQRPHKFGIFARRGGGERGQPFREIIKGIMRVRMLAFLVAQAINRQIARDGEQPGAELAFVGIPLRRRAPNEQKYILCDFFRGRPVL